MIGVYTVPGSPIFDWGVKAWDVRTMPKMMQGITVPPCSNLWCDFGGIIRPRSMGIAGSNCTICLAIFCGDIPWNFAWKIGLIYGRYLQFRFLKWPLSYVGIRHEIHEVVRIHEPIYGNLMGCLFLGLSEFRHILDPPESHGLVWHHEIDLLVL